MGERDGGERDTQEGEKQIERKKEREPCKEEGRVKEVER